MQSLFSSSRARTLLLALVLTAGAFLVVAASPAAAAEAPARSKTGSAAADAPAAAFRAILEAIDRVRVRGTASPVAPAPPEASVTDVDAPVADDADAAARASTERAQAEANAGCREAGDSNDVPQVVADIFLCRLSEAGIEDAQARRIAAEAVVVSHCESKWDADIVVFDGRYLDQAHPRTGNRYSAAGVFQFIRATADKWIDGGYGQVTDARRNIDAAARLFIHNRALGLGGWGDWACAAVNDGFKQGGSVLPGWPGGPAELPQWALRYVQ